MGLSNFRSPHPAVVAVVGCGGKTTFISTLAAEFCQHKTLISPTTKILAVDDKPTCKTSAECLAHTPQKGTQYLGIYSSQSGKLTALPQEILGSLVPAYDLALLESDGSRGLPCKGWQADEPVIPSFCTHTVGIVTLIALGEPANEKTVMRLPLFLKLTGLSEGDAITENALIRMVCHADGMLKNSVGKRMLFVNQAETNADKKRASAWLQALARSHGGMFEVLAFGSARQNKWEGRQ